MPNIYRKKGTRYWWCWGRDVDGKQWDQSTKQTEATAAKLAAREIERRFAADPGWAAKSGLTVERGVDLVLDFQRASGKAEATLTATRFHGRHLVEHLGSLPLPAVTLADTTRYLHKRLAEGGSRHTISKELKTLTQAMRRAAKLGLYVPTKDPKHFTPDELGKVYTPRDRWLTRAEYTALLAALAPTRRHQEDRRDYVIAWCNLGLRKSELFSIEPGDFSSERKELRVRGTKTESADRLVPVNGAAAEVLERRCTRDVPFPRWVNGSINRDLKLACRRVEKALNPGFDFTPDPTTGKRPTPPKPFPDAGPNDFRRTFCSWLCQAGVSERYCAELLGHDSTNMVRAVYGHLDRSALAAAVARI
jgi:integrase